MACDCQSSTIEIENCPPFANKASVEAALAEIVGDSCCLGIIDTIVNNPIGDAVTATDLAFPDGLPACCDCYYIMDENNFTLYVSCDSGLTWNFVGNLPCSGSLTTQLLSPDDDPVTAIAEAFPNGIPSQCGLIAIQREDNVFCFSVDGGTTFYCTDSQELDYLYIHSVGGVAVSIDGVTESLIGWNAPAANGKDDSGLTSNFKVNASYFTFNTTREYNIRVNIAFRPARNDINESRDLVVTLAEDSGSGINNVVGSGMILVGDATGTTDLIVSGVWQYKGVLTAGNNYYLRARLGSAIGAPNPTGANIRTVHTEIKKV